MFRQEHGRALATLIRLLGDFERAEEALADAFVLAVERWPVTGLPANPRAWLVTAGRNRAVDGLRRGARFASRESALAFEAALAATPEPPEDHEGPDDDVLRLIFTCCHPALDLDAQVALTLRTVCGLPTGAVARAFLVPEATMAQRLVRATRKIRLAGIPYRTPPTGLLDERLQGVLAVIYLVFTEGYGEGAAGALTREALRLGALVDQLLPGRGDVQGLLALMILHEARAAARRDVEGAPVLLDDQDRRLWDRAAIVRGASLVQAALSAPGPPSPYAVQAAIAALHAQAPSAAATDWPQILGLYEVLLRLQPTPVVELNRAVAVSMVDGPARALDLIDALAACGALARYHLLHSARAALLARLGRGEEARAAYRAALDLATAEGDRRWLERRLEGA